MIKKFIFILLFSFYSFFPASYISLFDSSTATIGVGTRPSGLAITLDGDFIYVANVNSDTVSVINSSTNAVVKTISGFDQPNSIKINPSGTKAYVTNSNILGVSTVSVIDINSLHKTTYNTIISTIVGFSAPYSMAITLDGKFGYVANFASASIQRVNLTTNTIVGIPIAVGTFPSSIVMTPDGNYVYVANYNTGVFGKDTVSVISTDSSSSSFNKVIKTISGFFGPYDLVVNPEGTLVYVTNYGNFFTSKHGTTVSIIDANPANSTFNTIINTITVGSQPAGITINPEGNYAFVTLYNEGNAGSLVTIQLSDNTLLSPSFSLGNGPVGVIVSPNGLNVYVTNYNDNNVEVLSFINTFAISLFNCYGSITFIVSNMYQNAYPLSQTIGYIFFGSQISTTIESFYFNVQDIMESQYCQAGTSGVSCTITPLNVRVFVVGNNGNNFYFDIPYDNLPIGPNTLNIDFSAVLNQISLGQSPTAQLINASSITTCTGILWTLAVNPNIAV